MLGGMKRQVVTARPEGLAQPDSHVIRLAKRTSRLLLLLRESGHTQMSGGAHSSRLPLGYVAIQIRLGYFRGYVGPALSKINASTAQTGTVTNQGYLIVVHDCSLAVN